jgi:glycosyltransferase involved in cell wall biosynthesis
MTKMTIESFITIIMPVRNEKDYIEKAIKSLLANDYPADKLELIVVDGMSDDGTREIVQKLSASDSRIKLLDNPRKIVPTAMNIGLKAAKGDIFIRIDGHATIAPDFIMKSIRCLQDHPDAWVVGGHIETISDTFIGRTIAAAMRSPAGVGNSRFRVGDYEGWVDTLAFGTHHKWILDKIGYFDEELLRNQDDEFSYRIIQAGGKIWLSKSIRSIYYARGSLKKLWRQYFQYGFWRIRTMQKHKKPATFRQVIPLLFVSSILLLTIFGTVWTPLWYLLYAEFGIYLVGILMGAFDVGRKAGWWYAPLSPVVFLILHFAYGLGSLWGIIRFMLLKGMGLKKIEEMKMSR